MDKVDPKNPMLERKPVRVLSRSLKAHQSLIRLADGRSLLARRYFPAGKEDALAIEGEDVFVYVRRDACWIEIGRPWAVAQQIELGGVSTRVTFKEIESEEELSLFDELRRFHYRGGGGAGRTVPIIATSDLWDLPKVLGFIEVSSSMIANTARRQFFDSPYSEPSGLRWNNWDRAATKEYSNIICRISRFVIHPEIRGLGLAKHFTQAAREYASQRWHYGGFRPRFLEITADMLRYYKFVDPSFVFMGFTEGNQHRLTKDMTYLVRKALSEQGLRAMPQGGGGIMTLQRGYASQLLRFLNSHNKSLPDVISSLRHDPSQLDQATWESLHRLNRRPKPSYTAGLTPAAVEYAESRRRKLSPPQLPLRTKHRTLAQAFRLTDVSIHARVAIAQSADARILQDTFGFVGADLSSDIVRGLSFDLVPGELTLVCGASGSGKTLLTDTVRTLLSNQEAESDPPICGRGILKIGGSVSRTARVVQLDKVPEDTIPLDLRGKCSLEEFLRVTAKCGLAEPQLFVRPSGSLSSGQKYRLQIALAFLQNPDVVVIDNFCEPLDRYTAMAVCRGLKSLAIEHKVAVLSATASYERLQQLVRPDQVILLRRADKPLIQRNGTTYAV